MCSQELCRLTVRCIVYVLLVKPKTGAMYVVKVGRRHGDRVYASHLIQRSIREGKRVRHLVIVNFFKLPVEAIEALLGSKAVE